MKLYDVADSGNCYKIRLMSALLGLDCQCQPISLEKAEHKTPEFLAMNPRGQVPVLVDDAITLWDSHAILIYLAGKKDNKTDTKSWWSNDITDQADITQWLSFSAREMWAGCAVARATVKFKRPFDLNAAQKIAYAALDILERHLSDHEWLALDRPTIADIAVYPYAGLVWEGGISLAPYPAMRRWFNRIEALPGYVPMSGLHAPE